MIKKLLPPLLLAIVAILPLIFWYSFNTVAAHVDAADYMAPPMRAYLTFEQNGWWDALISLYTDRTWKPIFFPVLALPALILTGNQVGLSAALTMLGIQLAIALYVYLFLRERHDQYWSAFLSIVIMTVPIFLSNGTEFLTENALALSVLGAFYHGRSAIQNGDTRSVTSSLLWFSLALLVRPIEGSIILAPGFIFMCFLSAKRKLLDKFSLAIILLVLACEATLIFLSFFNLINSYPFFYRFCCFVPLALVGYGVWEKLVKKRHSLSLGVGLCLTVISIWYAPFTRSLVHWIYECTFGEIAARTGGRRPGDWVPYLIAMFRELSIPVVSLFVIGSWLSNGWKKSQVPWGWIAAIVPTFTLGFMSHNSLSRYYTTPLLLMLVLLALHINRINFKRGFFTVIVLLLGLLINVAGIVKGLSAGPYLNEYSNLYLAKIASPRIGDETESYLKILKRHLPTKLSKQVFISVLLMKPAGHHDYHQLPEPWALTALSLQEGMFYDFQIGWTQKGLNRDERVKLLHCLYDYVLIGPLDGEVNKIWDQGSELGYEIMSSWKHGKLAEFKFEKPIVLATEKLNPALQYLLVETNREALNCGDLTNYKLANKLFN